MRACWPAVTKARDGCGRWTEWCRRRWRCLDRGRHKRYYSKAMSATFIAPRTSRRSRTTDAIPPLEPGDHLTPAEFLRRYEAMPDLKKAELIQGIVYMAPPVRIDFHAEPDNLIQGWLCNYAVATKGV